MEGTLNPIAPLFAELMPFIERVLAEFVKFDEICESVCRVVKHSVRSMGAQFEPYLAEFIRHVMVCYQKNAIGSFVYSVEFCFLDFQRDPKYHPLFREAFEFICKHTNTVFATR